MAFTPSNLSIATMGSMKLILATQNASTASGTDLWTSGIPDIQAIIPVYTASVSSTGYSSSPFAVSFTQSSGTVHIIRDASNSGTAFNLLILAGFASDMTW